MRCMVCSRACWRAVGRVLMTRSSHTRRALLLHLRREQCSLHGRAVLSEWMGRRRHPRRPHPVGSTAASTSPPARPPPDPTPSVPPRRPDPLDLTPSARSLDPTHRPSPPTATPPPPHPGDVMHHLLIGEGQIGQEIAHHALRRGDTLTILRRSAVTEGARRERYGQGASSITAVDGDVLDQEVLRRAAEGAQSVLACFHAPYDARIWDAVLPPREQVVLDIAQDLGIPVVFPESMYAFQGDAARLSEGVVPTPRAAKGRIRVELMGARRRHGARTVSVVASDLVGPTSRGTGAAVATALVIEPLLAGRPVLVPADPEAPHSLTHLPDLAEAMLFSAREAELLTREAPGQSVVLHAPTDTAHSLRELAALTAQLAGVRR